MFYHIETEERGAGGKSGTVYTLRHNDGSQAEVWPANGFNCLRWRIVVDGHLRDLLYTAPDWESNPVPTRSGIPVLFPFPNRIRDGRYSFGWKDYQLPLNDSVKQNAIHGYAPRHAWQVFGYGSDQDSAWIHGDFHASVDAPETVEFWPADYRLSLIYRLTENSLRLESRVRNLGSTPLPFGLGFHPYFRFPCADESVAHYRLHAPARSIWECVDSLPTGERQSVADAINWNTPRPINSTQLDTLYTDLGAITERPDGMLLRAELTHETLPGALQVWTNGDFRESVLFTPPHRQAVCIEPYTCGTDAINLAERKIDAGLQILPPDGEWTGCVEFRWEPSPR